ncbi:hypothetical protein GE061_017549 [Apolygus lucorum]|uniref:Uncharacterized protein n=1 Tax=Apolygus lucorum TaxID=248454 RepID=A0A6A4J9N7_APOLU|nr:hypothetical protein GE061_017549 [Apolygus lucorum]
MGLIPKLFLALSIVTTNLPYSSNYTDYVLDPKNRNNLCSSSFPHREMEIKENGAIRINFTLSEEEQNSNSGFKQNFICVFFLKVPEGMGIFGVIQKMSFRRDSRTNDCTDYIQFRHSKNRGWVEKALNVDLERKTENWNVDQVCGEVTPLQEQFAEIPSTTNDVARHATLNRANYLAVKVNISKKKLKPNERIEIIVAFTPFKECLNDTEEMKSCGHNTCILKSYFNDRIVNCPFVNCVDEECSPLIEEDPSPLWSGKIAVTAVSSIFLSFFLFLGCIMMCRYAEMFCWGDGHPPDRGTELSEVEPTAPPHHDTPSPDKDLPPAYETLFPSER